MSSGAQRSGCYGEVVADEIALRVPALGKENLVGIGDRYLTPGNGDHFGWAAARHRRLPAYRGKKKECGVRLQRTVARPWVYPIVMEPDARRADRRAIRATRWRIR